jgi:hypothetical protein
VPSSENDQGRNRCHWGSRYLIMLVNLLRQVNDLPNSSLELESEMAKFIVRSEPPTGPYLAVTALDAADALQLSGD